MSKLSQKIADNLARIHERIASAAASVGRGPDDVQLVAVSKYVGIVETEALLNSGCHSLGESRPQQIWEKATAPELSKAEWHLIGHLQRNKVRRTLPLVSLLHSVDSLRLLEAIEACASELDLTTRVLLEVNCSGDEAKDGLAKEELHRILPELHKLQRVSVCGLMTMAALEGGAAVAERNFAALRELLEEMQCECPPNVKLSELSMGMSQDFEAAVRQGATIVRVGSLLFEGLRN
jgi:pyridoxal phosphate enzyme (YggS family)